MTKLLVVLTLPAMIILQQALPSKADGRGCVYYDSDGVESIAQDGTQMRFDDGLNECMDGKWIVIGD